LSTRLRQKELKIQEVLEKLAEESLKGTPTIVEGKKDVTTLRELGIEGKVISTKTGGKTCLDVVTEVEASGAREVILLLDFDRRGKELTHIFKRHFEKTRTKPNLMFWNDLLRFVGRELKDIEGLATYMKTLKKKIDEA
jgi:2,5-diamino-6-(ribosylamino)-4(3H)-pyrimidinone 5'-phosphate reductase